MKRFSVLPILLLLPLITKAQSSHGHDHEHNQKIWFPDLPDYQTITCDFHMHTVFSDGSVWPNIRVDEALREGLDCIATTEHLEYQPHREDIPHPDRNRAYELASKTAEGTILMVVSGSEITRGMPPGHTNAVFVQDANLILKDDAMDAFEEANRQGAFVFTNHPHWTSQRKDGVARYEPMHIELIGKNWLHGIEVVNETTYSDEALQLAIDHNLTFIGTSDVHGLTDWMYNIPHGGHRPLTLVFAKDKSKEGIREALFNRQTVVWFKDMFIGRMEWLEPILRSSLTFESSGYSGDTSLLMVRITNPTHSRFILSNETDYTFHEDGNVFIVEPESTKELLVKTLKLEEEITLRFQFMNGIFAPSQHPILDFRISTNTN